MKILYALLFLLLFATSNNAQNLSKFSYAEIDSLVLIPEAEGDYLGCVAYMAAGRDKAKLEFGVMDTIYAKYTADLGFFYYYLGQLQDAEPLFLEAQKIRLKIQGEEHPEYIMNLDNLSSLYQDLGYLEKAEVLCLKSKNLRAKTLGEDHPDFARSLNNLAILYQDMGNYEKAEPLYLQARNLRAKTLGEEHPSFARSLNNLASLYHDMHLYENAETLYLQAMNIRARTLGKEHHDYAQSLNNLAHLYHQMQQYDKAEKLYLQAKSIWSKVFGEEHYTVATALNNLALLYQITGNFAKAEQLYLQTNNLDLKNYGEKHPDLAASFNNLAYLYCEMGQFDRALSYSHKSIVANSESLDSTFNDWSTLDKVDYFSNEVINKSITTLLIIFQEQYKKTGNKANLELHYQTVQAAIRLNEVIRNEFSGESDKLRNLATNNKLVLQAIHSALSLKGKDYAKDAFAFAELNKGVLLMDAAKTERAYQFGDLPDSLANQERALQKSRSAIKAQLLEHLSKEEKSSLNAQLVSLNQQTDAFAKKINRAYPKYAAIKYHNKTAEAKDIQVLLDSKTALLEYVIGDSVIYIFYIDKQQVLVKEVYVSNQLLSKKIKDLHGVLSNYKLLMKESSISYRKYTEDAYWFYKNLVEPVLSLGKMDAKNASQIEHLIIVSDGEIGHLPFEAFLVELASQKDRDYKKLHYLVNDYKISYNYAATIWKANKENKKNKNNGQLFAMAANYNIKLDTTKNNSSLPAYQRMRVGLSPLPVARQEVEILAAEFAGFFAFDSLASERIFKEKASNYAIIHLAMHGLLDSKSPILSSIAFTETSDLLENDFLQAYEISKMQLNADLVILSACETGFGKFEKGNGIASLAQAFSYAGAPALIVSLWQVNDQATSEIMKQLYKNLALGMTKDEALQQAKLYYIKNAQGIAAHPAFWSPFIQMGNTDAIYLEKKGGFGGWFIGGLFLVVLSIVGLFYKKNSNKDQVKKRD